MAIVQKHLIVDAIFEKIRMLRCAASLVIAANNKYASFLLNRNQYRIHGLALINARAVLGLDSQRGSPFNIQRSLHVPNFTQDEVTELVRSVPTGKWADRRFGGIGIIEIKSFRSYAGMQKAISQAAAMPGD